MFITELCDKREAKRSERYFESIENTAHVNLCVIQSYNLNHFMIQRKNGEIFQSLYGDGKAKK